METNDEFEYFYDRHIAHNVGRGKATVLVADETYPINNVRARIVLEQALRIAILREKMNKLSVEIPQVLPNHVLSIREWDFDRQEFITPGRKGFFIFRDIIDIASRKLLIGIQNTIANNEFSTILKFIEGAKTRDENYIVVRILFIGKYFVSAAP